MYLFGGRIFAVLSRSEICGLDLVGVHGDHMDDMYFSVISVFDPLLYLL